MINEKNINKAISANSKTFTTLLHLDLCLFWNIVGDMHQNIIWNKSHVCECLMYHESIILGKFIFQLSLTK